MTGQIDGTDATSAHAPGGGATPGIEDERPDDVDDSDDAADRAAADRDLRAQARDARARRREKCDGGIDQHAENARRAAAADRNAAAADRARSAADRARARSEQRAADEVRRWSTIDALTGLLRREAGLSQLHRLHQRAHHADEVMVVAFVDVDGLKQVNDSQGHSAGDVILRTVATALVSSVRQEGDVVMRYGGDEFLIGVCGLTIADLTSRLTRTAIGLPEKCGVSITFGTARARGQEDLYALIDRADTALYATRRRLRLT